MPAEPTGRTLAAIAGASASMLLAELALTRIFSVTMFHHFAFFAVSMALLGLSASGIFVYLTPRLHPPEMLFARLRQYALLAAGLTLLAALVAAFLRVKMAPGFGNLVRILALYLAVAAPFFASGAVLTLAVAGLQKDVNRVYGADLAGAALGCLLLLPALDLFGGVGALLVSALLAAASALLFGKASDRLIPSAACAALGLALAGQSIHPFLDIRWTKGEEAIPAIFSKWNSFSRVAVYDREVPDWGVWRGFYKGPHPRTLAMDIDASAATPVLVGMRDKEDAAFLRQDLTALGYSIFPKGGHALVIGPGGGRDLWAALLAGASTVQGVEINPIIVDDVMRGFLADASGNVYSQPGVSVAIEDGRSFIRRSESHYDLIQASVVDTWAATSAGAFALTENNLYTVEAFEDYFRHLTPNGLVNFSRWVQDGVRLIALMRTAGENLGWPALSDRLFIAGSAKLATFVCKATPFTTGELARLRAYATASGFMILYEPGMAASNPYARIVLTPDPERFYRESRHDVSPTTDDRPFFFHSQKLRDVAAVHPAEMLYAGGLDVIFLLLGVSAALVALFVLVPLALFSKGKAHREPGALRHLAYFASLGAGFMLVEIGLTQRFVLLLGHPVYSLTVVLFTLLLGGGIGSALGRKSAPRRALLVAIPAIILTGILYAVFLPPLFAHAIALPLAGRVALSIVLLFPLAVALGVPLPAGVALLSDRPSLVPWAWGLNGATSVLGATAAVGIAIVLGFRAVAFSGSAVYLVALILSLGRPTSERRGLP